LWFDKKVETVFSAPILKKKKELLLRPPDTNLWSKKAMLLKRKPPSSSLPKIVLWKIAKYRDFTYN